MRLSRGILLGIITVLLILCFRIIPSSAEVIYGQLFYPMYQYLRSFLTDISPVPLIYIFFLYILGWIIFKIIITPSYKKWKWLSSARMLFSIIGFLFFFFYLLWGFNYLRPTMEDRLSIEFREPDSTYITSTYLNTIDSLNSLRRMIDLESTSVCNFEGEWGLHKSTMKNLKNYFNILDYPNTFEGSVFQLFPEGLLLRWGTAGFFFPYVGEGYIDSGLPDIEKPFTIAHEMSHVYGITEEGEANFLAYRACQDSDKKEDRYSAYLAFYPYISNAVGNIDSSFQEKHRQNLDDEVLKDFKDIYKCLDKFPDIMPDFRDLVYDSYLQSHGVEGGIKNYSRIIMLDYNWELLKKEQRFLRRIN